MLKLRCASLRQSRATQPSGCAMRAPWFLAIYLCCDVLAAARVRPGARFHLQQQDSRKQRFFVFSASRD